MRLDYVVKRLLMFLVIVWAASTLNFFIPRVAGQDPVRLRLLQQSLQGGYLQSGMEEMVAAYDVKFGLDKPLWRQYLTYLGDMIRLDFNYSITNYPKTVIEIIKTSMFWTIGLMAVTSILAFLIGCLLGALIAWPRSPRWIGSLTVPFLTLSAVPYYLLGLILLYVFAFKLRLLPMFGGYTVGSIPNLSWDFVKDVARHSVLPAGSIILSAVGYWGLSMRGMIVTIQDEDYMIQAEAKGLKGRTLFRRYAVRNAILPQVTALAISAGFVFSQVMLVEIVFGYPGLGTTLYFAIRGMDYYLVQGIIFMIILITALATLLIDVTMPLIDPRITHRRA